MFDSGRSVDDDDEDDYEARRPFTRRFWKDRLKGQCVEQLNKDGWRVYTRGFPTVIAEKGNFVRMIVVRSSLQSTVPGSMGKHKDALSRVFLKCFGVKYEVWEDAEMDPADDEDTWA